LSPAGVAASEFAALAPLEVSVVALVVVAAAGSLPPHAARRTTAAHNDVTGVRE
jgi:hypothetical protein